MNADIGTTHVDHILYFNHLPKAEVLKLVPRPAAAAPSGSLLEMQIRGPHPRSTDSETQGAGLMDLCCST